MLHDCPGSRGAMEIRMQAYAVAFAAGAICSLMFVGSDVKRSVHHIGIIATVVFTLLFIGTEILALVT